MKKVFILFAFLSLIMPLSAQTSTVIKVDNYSLDEDGENVRISIKTTESFIVGANRYVLHIGGKHFMRNLHPEGRLDEMVFLIPLDEFEALEAKARIVLVYGYYYENTLQDNEGSQANGFLGRHWDLGHFIPQKLNKK